jgi:hypothetical protein
MAISILSSFADSHSGALFSPHPSSARIMGENIPPTASEYSRPSANDDVDDDDDDDDEDDGLPPPSS